MEEWREDVCFMTSQGVVVMLSRLARDGDGKSVKKEWETEKSEESEH